MKDNDIVDILTPAETRALVTSLLTDSGEKGALREDVEALLTWAAQTRTENVLLSMLIAGTVQCSYVDGEMNIRITPPVIVPDPPEDGEAVL